MLIKTPKDLSESGIALQDDRLYGGCIWIMWREDGKPCKERAAVDSRSAIARAYEIRARLEVPMPEPTQRKENYPPQRILVYCPKCRKELRVYVRDIAEVSSETCPCGETVYVSINVD